MPVHQFVAKVKVWRTTILVDEYGLSLVSRSPMVPQMVLTSIQVWS